MTVHVTSMQSPERWTIFLLRQRAPHAEALIYQELDRSLAFDNAMPLVLVTQDDISLGNVRPLARCYNHITYIYRLYLHAISAQLVTYSMRSTWDPWHVQ